MWLVLNIGCIECGVSSAVVGLYSTEENAKSVAKILNQKANWREGGQNEYEVHPLPAAIDASSGDYLEYLL